MKKIALVLATCGLILSSCSSNDVFEDNQGTNNPNVINFSATTTRATVNNLGSVQGGFPVYAVKTSGNNKEWHINGQSYKFESNTWNWVKDNFFTTIPQWPNAIANYPMNFYAYYPASPKTGSDADYAPVKGTNVNELTATIKIGSTAEKQEDYLAANTTGIVNQMSTVPLQFKHITTKINFGVIAAAGTKSYVQQMNINNVKNQGTYDYVLAKETEDNQFWSNVDFTKNGETVIKPAYDYYGTTTATVETENPLTYKVKDVKPFAFTSENAAQSFYPFNPTPENPETEITADEAHLMLLPQAETPVWDGKTVAGNEMTDDNKLFTPSNAYIGSVYRMTAVVKEGEPEAEVEVEKDLVGYTTANNHPNYTGSATAKANYTGPLFVKVGFPLPASFSWIMGKAYTYNIMLGQFNTSGGLILDKRYYDQYGNPTDLLIEGKNIPDKVFGGDIHFHVTVDKWEDGQTPGGSNENGSGGSIN